jgi:transposase
MFALSESLHYYLYNQPTDMRKSFDSLCQLVETGMRRNGMSGEVFLFINRPRNRMKLLRWEYGGFILYYKRLERGTLQADGYSAYEAFEKQPGITLLACMAHARRKFDEALKNDQSRAEHALKLIQQLYAIERQAREEQMDADQRKAIRQEKAGPILAEFQGWLKENIIQVLPKSAIGIAIAYTLHLWPRLVRYLEDGRYEIDNNRIGNSIRPVALGRKNYLFAGSHEGARRAAIMYSFLGTCKINNVEPFQWLSTVLKRIPDHSIQRLEELLPQNLQ